MVLFMLLVVPVKGLAQGVTISGQVTDDMDVVIGATVKVVPGNTGTVTDVDGNFKLTVPSSAKSLVISYVGYKTKTVDMGAVHRLMYSSSPRLRCSTRLFLLVMLR